MQEMVKLLHERMLNYNWVGFYMLEPARNRRCWCWERSKAR